MFVLNNRLPIRAEDIPEANEAIMKMKDSIQGLSFDPETHTYTMHGHTLESVSSIVSRFHEPFDAKAMAQRCATNPKHEMFGIPVEDIIRQWEINRDKSASLGTAVHEFGEACFLWCTGKEHLITGDLSNRITPNGLVALTSKEEAVAKWWQDLDATTYVPVAKEAMLANPLLGYAGTLDLLLYNLKENQFELRDYKTNKDLFRSFGKMLLPPLNIIPADDRGKYTIQQNLYRIELTNLSINVARMKLIWLKEDGVYEEVELQTYAKLISFAVGNLKLN